MKAPFLRSILDRTPRLTRWDVLGLAVPGLLWLALILLRPVLIAPRCGTDPSACRIESLWVGDRIAVLSESGDADLLSYFTQNTAGIAAAAVPLAFHLVRGVAASTPWLGIAGWILTDWVVTAQTVMLNGVGVELSHLLWQRPRPFVYQNPAVRGLDPHHYTSFYSGHTSATAAMALALLLGLVSYGAPRWLLLGVGLMGEGLVVTTAIFRVLAGRHFVSDTWVAVMAGSLVALGVALLHRTARPVK